MVESADQLLILGFFVCFGFKLADAGIKNKQIGIFNVDFEQFQFLAVFVVTAQFVRQVVVFQIDFNRIGRNTARIEIELEINPVFFLVFNAL